MRHKRTTRLFTIVTLVTVLLSAAAPLVYADGTWTNQVSLIAPSARSDPVMASLGGDQVLLFGGYDVTNYLSDTWVYDLSDNTWTNQAPAAAPSARSEHAMVSLGGDQVLLFGGHDGTNYLGDTWVYDLSDNTWTNQTSAAGPSARSDPVMASLGGDQVLLFGGYDGTNYLGDTWVYDLSDNTWTNQTPAAGPSAREGHAMVSLGGDQVLLFGGYDGSPSSPNGDTWVYDLSANTWTNRSPTVSPSGRYGHAMASLGGGQVLLFGGYDGAYYGDTWVYDLSANTWTNQAPPAGPSAREGLAMAYLGDDQVLLFGGAEAGYNNLNGETWIYDLSTNSWTNQVLAAAPSARMGHAMAYTGGDQMLLFGGEDASWNPNGETWVYDLSANTWTNQAPAAGPSGRYAHAMASLGGDQVLLFGGWDGSSNLGDSWVYDLSANAWTNQAPAASPSVRHAHAMASLGGDQVLLFGGYDGTSESSETWVYDLSANTWTNQAPAAGPSGRYAHAMASLGGDQVLLFGGYDGTSESSETWVYDLSANTWTNQAPAASPSARYSHAMASLGGGQVLLFGGNYEGSFSGQTWVYDLSANTWTNQAPAASPSARCLHAMASLGGGQVLLFGGADANRLDDDTWLASGFRNNQPPVADAGSDQAVNTLALVTLDGTGSTDPDGDLPLTYLWTQTGGPVVTFTPHLSVTTFTAPGNPGVLTFTLTVTDSLGSPDPTLDEVVITVNNQSPVAGAGPDQAVSTLALVTLDGRGSTDPDGDLPLAYWWAQTGGPAVTFTPHLSVTTFTAPGNPGVLTFTLTVTDSLGSPDPTLDEVVITVNNQPPIAGAGLDQAVNTMVLVTLDGSRSNDPDGDLPLTYLWAQTGGPAVTFTSHLSVTTFTAPGDLAVLTFTLTVTDSLGSPDPTPDEVVITVTPYRVYLPLVVRSQ